MNSEYGWNIGGSQNQNSWGSSSTNKSYQSDYSTTPNFAFSNSTIRNNFVKKVLSIVSAQLAVTAFFVGLFTFHQGALAYAYNNPWMMNLTLASTVILTLAMSLSQSIRRSSPMNLIVLGAYTISQGFLVGIVSSFYQVEEVIYAVGLTCAIVFGLTLYASSTKEDFTLKGGMMMSALMALSIGSIVSMFYRGEFFNFILACGGAAVFSMYIIYDLQMIMGDKAVKISPEEYIFAALSLYVDIVRIFLELLKILRYLNEAQQSQQRDKRKRN